MLLLTWDHPIDINPYSARLARGSYVVRDNIPWGVVADPGNDDASVGYTIEYTDREGVVMYTVQNRDIRRGKLPVNTCEVTFTLTGPDGLPDANRRIELSNSHEAGVPEYGRIVSTNSDGIAVVYLKQGVQQYVYLENAKYGLQTVIPNAAVASYDDLIANGSQQLHDRRGWF